MLDYRLGIVACLGLVVGGACYEPIKRAKRDGGPLANGGRGGNGSSLGGSGGGGRGGSGGSGGSPSGVDAAVDRAADASQATDAMLGPTPAFVAVYDNVLRARCAPCHVTSMPRAAMLDLGDVMTAYTTLTTGLTTCATAMPRDLVVPGRPDDSYLVKKLSGAMGICGLRMPRGCVDDSPPPDAGAGGMGGTAGGTGDGSAGAGGTAGAGADAALPPPPVDMAPPSDGPAIGDGPRPASCLAGDSLGMVRNWIMTLSKIRALMVHDTVYGAGWSIQGNFQIGPTGARPWIDWGNTYIVSVDPGLVNLIGKPWIRVAAESKRHLGGPQATISISAPAEVYLVVDDRWGVTTMMLPWLAGWNDTGLDMIVWESNSRPNLRFSVFRQSFPAGNLTVPPIGSTLAYNYFIIVE